MKIGLVCPYNIVSGGGVQECVFALQAELRQRNHEVLILTPQPYGENSNPPKGVLYIGKAAKVKSFHTTAQISASAEPEAIKDLLSEHDFDLLHFHEPWVPFVSRQILSQSTACNVATFHAKLPESRMNRTIEKMITPYTKSLLKYLDGLTAVSDAATDYVKTLTDDKIHIVPNGIDLKKYNSGTAQSDSQANKQTIVFIGRLEKRKGIKYLLKAFQSLQRTNPTARLVIAGTGPDETSLKRFVSRQDIANVSFLGYVSEASKIKLLKNADLFCSPAIYGESFGIVLLEAMSLGTPIVAGDNPGYTSVMKGLGNISIVNPKNTALFAERLKLLLENDQLREQWKDWAKFYVKQFDYINVVSEYEELYKKFCQKSEQ